MQSKTELSVQKRAVVGIQLETKQEQASYIDSKRIAYLGEQVVNWCPKLGTVLANEEVIDGKSERGSHPVIRRPLKQWMFRITAYADQPLGRFGRT